MPRTIKETHQFVGRKNELSRLSRFFNDRSGGAILVAGDRGSGKTSLVMEAIKRREASLKNWRRFTLSRSVVLHIPLIVGSGIPKEDKPSYYRSLLMRTILRALENDLRKRKYSWLDLPERWFRSIGYVQNVGQLKPYSKFLSLNQKAITNLAVSLPASGGNTKGGVERAISGEVDIGDAALEIRLRELLCSYSSIHPTIVVLDELDKLPFDSNPIELEKIALLLKNLFSETNIHVVFIADEPPMGRILNTIAKDPFCPEKTLFKDMILLNQFRPSDFDSYFNTHVAKHINEGRNDEVKYALARHTNMMPSEIRKYLLQNGINNHESNLRSLMTDYGYLYHSPMQMFVTETLAKFEGKFDAYFDRVLYKALTIAGDIILGQEVDYIAWNDFRTLFWTTDLFANETEEQTKKLEHSQKTTADFLRIGSGQAVELPEIITQIAEFTTDQKHHLNRTLEYMVALLDRGGWINIDTAENIPQLIRLIRFNGDSFTVKDVQRPLEKVLSATKNEEALLEKYKQIIPAYRAAFPNNQSIMPEGVPDPIMEDGGGARISNFPLTMLNCFWQKLDEALDVAIYKIANSIADKLAGSTRPSATKEVKENGVIILKHSSEQYQIVLNIGQKPQFDISDKEKTYILNDKRFERLTSTRNARVKNLYVGDSWVDLDFHVSKIQEWLRDIT